MRSGTKVHADPRAPSPDPLLPASLPRVSDPLAAILARRTVLKEQRAYHDFLRAKQLESDEVFARHRFILTTRVVPDVHKSRTERELAEAFDTADAVVARFDGVPMASLKYKEYPGLEFRFAFQKRGGLSYLEVRGIMRCRALDIVAKRFDFADFTEAKVVEDINAHSYVCLLNVAGPSSSPFLPRQFVNNVLWRAVGLDAASLSRSKFPASVTAIFEVVGMPTTHRGVPESPDFVRGQAFDATYLYEHFASGKTEYVSYLHVDPGGYLPHFLMNLKIVESNGARILDYKQVFQRRRVLEELDELDGENMGEALVLAKRASRGKKEEGGGAPPMADVVGAVVAKHVALATVAARHPAFAGIVAAVLENKLQRAVACKTKLDGLTREEGYNIGGALAASLLSATDPVTGTAEWIGFYPALTELKNEYVWFEPMMGIVARRLLGESRWGLIMRMTLGLVLALGDVVSDSYMITKYFQQGQILYAYSLICCVASNLCLQVLFVLVQYKRASTIRKMKEVLKVMSLTKPIFDTYHVCVGHEHDVTQTVSPLLELFGGKIFEMVGESIPSSIIQAYAFIASRESQRSRVALVSLVLSMTTTAYVSVTITYDLDTDGYHRRTQSRMFGMIPDSSNGRIAAFTSMIVMSAMQIFGRTMAYALLAASSETWLLSMMGGETVLYLLYKVIRGDLIYFLPIEHKALSLVVSLICRVVRKLLADVTGLLVERGPLEMSGAYYSLNMLWSQVFPFIAVEIYVRYNDDADFRLSADDLRMVPIVLSLVWAASALTVAASIKRKFWRTFYSTETGPQYATLTFREANDDEGRFLLLQAHSSYIAPIRNEMKTWLVERYPIWQLEHPPWFNDAAVAKIPDDMLPAQALRDLMAKGGGDRKRLSFVEKMG